MIHRAICAAILTIMLASASCMASTEDVVRSFFPTRLNEKAVSQGRSSQPETAFVVLETAADGSPLTIVAAYSNGIQGMFRVLKASSGAFNVAFENNDFDGTNPRMELVDVDGDGAKEVAAYSTSFTGIQDIYLYKWDGSSLINLLPAGEELLNASLIDLYHDGTLQLVSVSDPRWYPGSGRPNDTSQTVYRIVNGKFAKDKTLLLLECFARSTAAPKTVSRSFTIPVATTGPFQLIVFNGGNGAQNRVSAARILLNGTEVVGPSQLNQNVAAVSVAISNLANQNTLQVEIDSKPGGIVWVGIENAAATPAIR